jgi:hypothetical protein
LTSSSIQDNGTDLAVSMSANSNQSTAQLIKFYTNHLAKNGFTYLKPATGKTDGPAAQATFQRQDGAEYLLLAIVDDGQKRSFSIGGDIAK